jgi:hypothetical protein
VYSEVLLIFVMETPLFFEVGTDFFCFFLCGDAFSATSDAESRVLQSDRASLLELEGIGTVRFTGKLLFSVHIFCAHSSLPTSLRLNCMNYTLCWKHRLNLKVFFFQILVQNAQDLIHVLRRAIPRLGFSQDDR